MRIKGRAILPAIALCVAATTAQAHQPSQRSAAELMDAIMWNRETIGGPFALVDHQGKRRTDADFRGKFMLVYFGFTACADVCPTDLQQITSAIVQLGAAGDAVRPIFITLDPARDTPKRLSSYVANFHQRLVGLTGTPHAIDQAASVYKVYYKKINGVAGGGYTVDHAAFIYLMDRQGKYLGFFPPGTPAERMIQVLRPYLAAP